MSCVDARATERDLRRECIAIRRCRAQQREAVEKLRALIASGHDYLQRELLEWERELFRRGVQVAEADLALAQFRAAQKGGDSLGSQ